MYKALATAIMPGDTITLDSTDEQAVVFSHRIVRNGRVEMLLRFPGERYETREFHQDARFTWQP